MAGLGLFVLGSAFSWWLVLGLVVFGVIATSPKLAEASLKLACAAVLAMLAVVAINVALGVAFEAVPDSWEKPTYRLPIAVGLVLAIAVFASIAYYYLRGTWLHPDAYAAPPDRNTRMLAPLWTRGRAAAGALFLAGAVLLGLPVLVVWIQERNRPNSTALPSARLESRLDVIIVSDRVRPDLPGGAAAASSEASVQYGVGQASGRDVLWTLAGADAEQARAALGRPGSSAVAPPELRDRADAAIVLLISPESNCGRQLDRWEAIAGAARESLRASIPAVALLSSSEAGAVACWRRSKGLAAVEELGTRMVTDAAAAAATAAASAQPYLEVAFAYRPILLFDSKEEVPRPLSIERMFERDRIRQCPSLDAAGECDTKPVKRAEDLMSPGMHLVIDEEHTHLDERADAELAAWKRGEPSLGSTEEDVLGSGSRIYVNPVPGPEGKWLYLDYWWYLRDNPAGTGKRAFCGAGLVIIGVTCFDHESDWEGVTVVLERSGEGWTPHAVHYAQHESVVRYPWSQLSSYWDRLTKRRSNVPDHAGRPIVFVARGTHASYPHRCTGACRQVPDNLEEGDHDGDLLWVGYDDAICAAVTCLAPLPTATGARGPASWNAFAGPWGRRHCFLKYYCDSGTPPPAPGQQDRYQDPAHYDGTADVTARDGGYVRGSG